MVPIAEKCVSLDQQFLTEERAVRLLNEDAHELFEVSPYEIDGPYDLIYCGSAIEPMANKELNKERTLQAYQLALADPAYQQDNAARLELFRQVLLALEVKNIEAVTPHLAQQQPQMVPGGGMALQEGMEGGGALGTQPGGAGMPVSFEG